MGKSTPPLPPSAYIFKITPGYRRLFIWSCDPKTRKLSCETAIRPMPGFTHSERYDVCAERLREIGIKPPEYIKPAPRKRS